MQVHARTVWCNGVRVVAAVAATMLWLACTTSFAQDDPEVVRVEEDWELVVQKPSPSSIAPQVVCAISPVDGVESLYAAFEVNHQNLPEFIPGGVQLQVWQGSTPLAYRNSVLKGMMETPDERVTWTQTMTLEDGKLIFEVIDGQSVTWGEFGPAGYLKSSVKSDLTSLNTYDPQVSVNHSGVSYASNLVESLVLRRVRLILSTGEVLEDETPRVVHSQN